MSESEFDVPGANAPRRSGMQITDDIPGTRLCLTWSGSKPWGWLRILVPLAAIAIFVSLGMGPRGPWQLAWEQITAPGPRDVVGDVLLGLITCGSIVFLWYCGSVLGQFAGYWRQISFDSNEQLVIADRHGWCLWGYRSTALVFGQLQFLSLSVGQEGRDSFPLRLSLTYRSRGDVLKELLLEFSLAGCDNREQALQFLLSIGRILAAKGYLKGAESPRLSSWQLALTSAVPAKQDEQHDPDFDEDLDVDSADLDEDDDEEEEGEEFEIFPIPQTADLGRQTAEPKGARSVAVDQRLAAKVDVALLNEKLVFTRVEEWKPGDRVRFVRDQAPVLVFVAAAVFGAVGGGVGGWPIYGFLDSLLGNDAIWWPGALALSSLTGAAILGFIAWNQLQEQIVDIDWSDRTITLLVGGARTERSFDDFRSLLLSGTTRTRTDSSSGSDSRSSTTEYGCRLDLVLVDQDLPLLISDGWESNQAAARDLLQPLSHSLAQALGLKCEWENSHRTDPASVRRAFTFTRPQQVVLILLAITAVVGIGRSYMQKRLRVDAGQAVRNLGGEATWLNGFSMKDKSVYKNYWKVEFKNDPEIDAHLTQLRPALLNVPELGLEFEACPLTDDGLRQLDQVKGLRVLTISNTRITDAGLPALTGCRELVYLNAFGNNITDAGLIHLGGLPKLRFLFLGGTQITDQGLAIIGKLPALEYLQLTSSAVTREGVQQFQATHPKIEVDFSDQNQ